MPQFDDVTYTGSFTSSGTYILSFPQFGLNDLIDINGSGSITATLSEASDGTVTGTWSFDGSFTQFDETAGFDAGTGPLSGNGHVSGTEGNLTFSADSSVFINGIAGLADNDTTLTFSADWYLPDGSGSAEGHMTGNPPVSEPPETEIPGEQLVEGVETLNDAVKALFDANNFAKAIGNLLPNADNWISSNLKATDLENWNAAGEALGLDAEAISEAAEKTETVLNVVKAAYQGYKTYKETGSLLQAFNSADIELIAALASSEAGTFVGEGAAVGTAAAVAYVGGTGLLLGTGLPVLVGLGVGYIAQSGVSSLIKFTVPKVQQYIYNTTHGNGVDFTQAIADAVATSTTGDNLPDFGFSLGDTNVTSHWTYNLTTGAFQWTDSSLASQYASIATALDINPNPTNLTLTGDQFSTSTDDYLSGHGGNDTIKGGAGHDILLGAAGGDKFVYDSSVLNDAAAGVVDIILDYDQGITGRYNASEGDQIDLSALSVPPLVRAVEDPSNAKVLLQVDVGSPGTWKTFAELDGLHGGDSVNVILHGSPNGTSVPVLSDDGHFGDFNGDSKADIVWRNDDGTVATWEMNGGTVGTSHFLTGVPSDWHIVGTGDFNGDAKSDILWLNDSGAMIYWQMTSASQFSATPSLPNAPTGSDLAGIGDVDHDGKSDLIWRNETTGAVTVNTTAGATGTTALGTDWSIVGIGDYNGDGKADIMFRNESQGINAAWLMNGTSVSSTAFYPGAPNDWHVVATGDFNGDGTADLFWHADNGANAVWLMNTSGNVQQAAFFSGVGTDWHVVGTGDFDGRTSNGHPIDDVVWREDNGATAVWLMNGAATPTVSFPGGAPTDWATQAHHYEFI